MKNVSTMNELDYTYAFHCIQLHASLQLRKKRRLQAYTNTSEGPFSILFFVLRPLSNPNFWRETLRVE